MTLELLKSNVSQEKVLSEKLAYLLIQNDLNKDIKQKKYIEEAIDSTKKQIIILNKTIPELVKNISLIRHLPNEKKQDNQVSSDIISLYHNPKESNSLIGINKKDKVEYLKQLQISEVSLKNIKKAKNIEPNFENEFKKANLYVVTSNRLFFNISSSLIKKGYFDGLKDSLKKGNFMMLLNSYVSVIFFTTLISFVLSAFVTLFLMFFNLSFSDPFISSNNDIIGRIINVIWIPIVIPCITFFSLYFYPNAEKSSIEKDIDYELPFATIQMAAIAGADIEPSNIFKIIALSKEYPAIRQESKKLMNQINLYGYDLINALRNVAMSSPSKNWADLLNGFSTTIRSGGDLSKYLNKRAETLLFEYKLKREKATKSAETFMDIYISVVIAAPMLLMLLLIMISISNIGFSLSIFMLTFIVVSIVSLINILFLIFLHINQKRI